MYVITRAIWLLFNCLAACWLCAWNFLERLTFFFVPLCSLQIVCFCYTIFLTLNNVYRYFLFQFLSFTYLISEHKYHISMVCLCKFHVSFEMRCSYYTYISHTSINCCSLLFTFIRCLVSLFSISSIQKKRKYMYAICALTI